MAMKDDLKEIERELVESFRDYSFLVSFLNKILYT